MAEPRSKSSPSGTRPLRNVEASYKTTLRSPPCYTIRAKTAFGDSDHGRTQTEPGGDLATALDNVRKKQPSWTLPSRAAGIPKPEQQPGPGEYLLPSTLYGSHPALPCAGRVPKTNATRPDVATKSRKDDFPSPDQYQTGQNKFGRVDQTNTPKYSIRTKLKDPADREIRPGAQKYILGKASRKGNMESPAYSMAPRGSGIPKAAEYPGPGYYALPGSIYGSHPAIPQPGRVAKLQAKRFEYAEPDDRPF